MLDKSKGSYADQQSNIKTKIILFSFIRQMFLQDQK